MSTGLKSSIKGGKTENEPTVETISLRGTTYTVRELDVVEYKECLKQAQNKETGFTAFGDLLEAIAMRAISPSPAAAAKPLPYPIYRRLEGIVNEMHFTDVESDEEEAAREATATAAAARAGAEGEDAPEEPEAPNS